MEINTIKVNLNDTVEVELSPYGKQIYDDYVVNNYCGDIKQNGCRLRIQLWILMQIFGQYIECHRQSEQVIRNNALIFTVEE